MLKKSVGLLNGTSIGGGQYTVNVYFQDASFAKYIRLNDYVEDKLSRRFRIDTWAGRPNDFVSGTQITVTFIDIDTVPATSGGYDSLAYTPNQTDVRPEVQSAGILGSATTISGQDYEYQLSASWSDSVKAAKAEIGDKIVDQEGKEYEITYLAGNKFSSPFQVSEVEKEGKAPTAGLATLYRGTLNYEFFQGTEITDPARTNIFNRDKFVIDALLKALDDSGTGEALISNFVNKSGGALNKLQPVRVSGGDINTIDVSAEAQVMATAGVVNETILNDATGPIVLAGRMKNITTTANFDDVIYLSKSGGITNVKPDIGVGGFEIGDFIVRLGIISKNLSNPFEKDLLINIEKIGQL